MLQSSLKKIILLPNIFIMKYLLISHAVRRISYCEAIFHSEAISQIRRIYFIEKRYSKSCIVFLGGGGRN